MEQRIDIQELPKHQRRIYEILREGKHSVADLSIKTGYSDPRGHIKALLDKGFNVSDEWRETRDGVRYKVYFVGNEG